MAVTCETRFPACDREMRRRLGDMLREVVCGEFAADVQEEARMVCGRCEWFPGDGKFCPRFSNAYGVNHCHSIVSASCGICKEFVDIAESREGKNA